MIDIAAREFLRLVLVISAFSFVSMAHGQPQGRKPGPDGMSGPLTRYPEYAAALTWDANNDGVFTCDEWRRFVTRLFVFADKNNDNNLSTEEFDRIRKLDQMFAGADLGYFDDNRDGRVSRTEFVDKPSPFFARYDANNDCKVGQEEIRAVHSPKGKEPPTKNGPGGPGGPGGQRGGSAPFQ